MVWLVAHRGGAALEMENTQKAFDRALKYPVDGLECDLQLSKDGVPLLFHDRSLYKFNLAQKRLKSYTFDEIRQFKIQPYRQWQISGQDILSYQAFLKRYKNQSKLFIEIKSRKGDRIDGTTNQLLKAMLKTHGQEKPKAQTVFMSFDHDLMKKVHLQLPKYQHIQLAEDPRELKSKYLDEYFGVGLPLQKVNLQLVSKYHQRGLKVLVYTCNGPRQLKKMKEAGVDIIVSDRPDWLVSAWESLN